MYISLNWLKDFTKLPSKLGRDEIARSLTAHTVEVESFDSQAAQFEKVVVGKVLSVEKHPNADRLRLAKVDVKKEILDIVCGAPNLEEGQLVPVALVGAVLPGGIEIKESEIRGEKSFGMICAEDELGLGRDHAGIMVLRSSAKVGEAFSKYLKLDDTVFEIDNKSLSNRPDLLCHYGLARELSAIFSLSLKPYDKFQDRKIDFGTEKLEVKIDDKEACPRYMAVRIEDIEIKESPAWLKERLIAVGQKPINNVVDLTNYIMLECGQPLHAFNGDNIKKILVRRAKKEETIETLDEKERALSEEDLVITDGKSPIALAGIMGGRLSGMTAESRSLILEAANFSAGVIRKTSQRIGLRTEASTRYEKALDPALTEDALYRFLTLMKELSPKMKIVSSLCDVDNRSEGKKEILLETDWLRGKIGAEIEENAIISSLESLGFELLKKEEGAYIVTVPSWRATKDIRDKEDLVEEVLRLYGYDKVASRLPEEELRLPEVNEERLRERKTKEILALSHGLIETYNYSFVGEDQLKKLGIDFFGHLKLANPLSELMTMLRQSLVPNLISNIKSNQAKEDKIGFFEIGSVFFNAPSNLRKDVETDETLPYQEKHLAIALADNEPELFLRLKGILSDLVAEISSFRLNIEFARNEDAPGWAEKGMSAKVIAGGKEIGVVAVLSREAASNMNLKKAAAFAELSLATLGGLLESLAPKHYEEPGKFPVVTRDLAFVLDDKIMYNEFKAVMESFDPLITKVELFDVYSGDKLESGEKSLAFHLEFRSSERTLTAEEVDAIVARLTEHMADRYEAKLRK